MPKGHPIAVTTVPWHRPVEHGSFLLKPASRSGYWNLWRAVDGTPVGNAVRTMIPAHEAASIWPEHADYINGRPDSSD